MAAGNEDLRADTLAQIRARIAATTEERKNTREKVVSGDWRGAEPDRTRTRAFTSRIDDKAGHAEASRGTNDFQPASFLPDGAKARRAVARTSLESPGMSRTATGFLISPELFLTNQHVINNEGDADQTQIIFDYELDERGRARPTTTFSLDPSLLFLASDEAQLDYVVVAVGPRVNGAGALADFGYCALSNTPDRHQLGINANIVQHPNGSRKIIVLRNNLVVSRDDQRGRLFYESDTLEGSSGAPVFNDLWDVIALHHYGEASFDVDMPDGSKSREVNEGIRVSSIYDDLSSRVAGLDGRARELLENALVLWKSDAPVEKTLTPGPRRTDLVAQAAEALAVDQVSGHAVDQIAATPTPADQPAGPASGQAAVSHSELSSPEVSRMAAPTPEAKIIVPLEITIRLAGTADLAPQAPAAPQRALAPAPRSLAEAKRLDRDYSNRNGFDRAFIPGVAIDLAEIVRPVKANIAALTEQDPQRATGEIAYENFSVVMHRVHRIAIVTATNIDGPSYIAIDRKTGDPAKDQPRPEGDTWYKDPRINEALTLTNDFYGEWSHMFDRGHLTRRNDPTWGPNAARANLDTFHFTNCSPQHWKFNESILFWQGVERYVLEQGLWETGLKKRLTVLQGPIYDAPQPLFADDVEIPNAFWKIIVWNGSGGLKAVALVVDQTDLLPIPRRPGGVPDETARVHVTQFRSTVKDIARRTGLNFDAFVGYDTSATDLPKIGEAQELLTSFDQIKVN